MGFAGLSLGILAAIGGWTPGLSYIAWIIAIIGIMLSAFGMRRANSEGQPVGVVTAGLVFCIIGFVISIIGLFYAMICTSSVINTEFFRS